MTKNPYLTVQALTKYVKRKFDADPHLRQVYVKGELSNVTLHPSGHIYFTLKDDKSRIRAVMFKMNALKLKFRPENGMNVLIIGDVSVYEASGQYQLYVQTMQPDGIGALYLAFEQLKEKLEQEGLFNEKWKVPLPTYPATVGVVTAQTGAAIQDICSTISRRYPLAEILLFPAVVQGSQAAPSIVEAIEQANRYSGIDVLIVGRGGGSIEDLWAFNEEIVARAIFSSRIPVISAVGHETDTTIADFVADKRAPTPTAAAELAVPSREELIDRTLDRKRALYRAFSYKIKHEQKRLTTLQTSYPLQFPERLYRPFIEKHIHLDERLRRSPKSIIERDEVQLERLTNRLKTMSPMYRVNEAAREISVLTNRLMTTSTHDLKQRQNRFSSTVRMLTSLNPLHVIERGYSIVYQDEKVQKSVEKLEVGSTVDIKMQDGTAKAMIKSIHKDDLEES
ncbi:exodeoxyribonuclease VII large subunit [Sporosarcina pasteurii]|uniref:Exodeoxyribonuclease 7 large subunit n=1 Tax=Sporosarcina pasteurii TaxID=1474 RepID=A0A380BPX7_SPOPA|nr:exodeoxyribonuclease VII large subunit [Sporosarcina pasteurii]MDS9471107.1 exodeoxyribonuclease VII large subunit [Sporosarcina pasteurii]QBQ05250.1 exodeoxyribonuclease VII large subunit [Sporosarcina pasteurii]SUJ04763.1 Exodeoxyribonuclease 7 large subunit [Sporosarcina pasteurii]